MIRPCVRSISALGWGIDIVAADATLLLDSAPSDAQGHRWQPASTGRHRLRVHRKGSLHALRQRHDRFLRRLIDGQFSPVPPVNTLDVVPYASDRDPLPRPHAVFKLLDDNEDPARYPHAKLIHIAGMVRHLAIEAMQKDPPPWIPPADRADFVNHFIRCKRDPAAGDHHKQISYIPLPSIGHEHADGIIRNVMLVAPVGMERELAHLAQRLDGQPLKPETASAARAGGDPDDCQSSSSPLSAYRAELRLFTPPKDKFIAMRYLATSPIWQSVTPVIFDGHVKKWKERDKDGKEMLLTDHAAWIAKALQRAGIETPCQFEWQAFPYFKNCLSAHKYDRDHRHTGYYRPNHLDTYTACHLRLAFDHPVAGPIAIGAGRHCGLGILAAV